jgi:SAM-dependent methyltransferase
LFAARGHDVLAVDRDADALASLAGVPRITTLRADLEDGSPWPLAERRFAAVIVANYLHRPLFPAILASLATGGILLYETFMAGNERYGKPSNPQFLLRAGELWQVFGASLEVRAFEQGYRDMPKPAMIQRLCAIARRIQ